jgi:hypothetical protein
MSPNVEALVMIRSEGLPGSWAVPFLRAVVEHPAGYDPLLAHRDGEIVVAFRQKRTLGIRDDIVFEAATPTARTLACLRFADPVAETCARLATGSGGLPLAGWASQRWTTDEVS